MPLLILYLLANADMQPRNGVFVSTLLGELRSPQSATASTWLPHDLRNWIAKKGLDGEWTVTPMTGASYSGPVTVITDEGRIHATGIWTPWRRSETRRLWIGWVPNEEQFSAGERAEHIKIYEKLCRLEPERFTPERREGDLNAGVLLSSVSVPGMLNDLSVLAAFIGLWFTRLGVIRRWREIRRGRFELRRLKRGVCRSCGYDRRGLPASSPCPECGDTRAPARM
jgi:hypothetical protein